VLLEDGTAGEVIDLEARAGSFSGTVSEDTAMTQHAHALPPPMPKDPRPQDHATTPQQEFCRLDEAAFAFPPGAKQLGLL
jgi:hypothetical protein